MNTGLESGSISRTRAVLAAALLALLMSGCGTLSPYPEPPVPLLAGSSVPEVAPVDLLALSDEMKQFAERQVRGRRYDNDRAWTLASAMLDPYILGFNYDHDLTLTADQAFERRRGNCLTFSAMFIAMARHAKIPAWFREVETDPEWSSVNDTLLVSRHVNAAASDRGAEYVVDVSGRQVRPGERHRKLSDREAEAHYYNNLGAGALIENDLPLAYARFRQAIETHPGQAYAWSNLGVVLKRNGQIEEAIDAYRTAQEIDPSHSVAMNNLFSLYEELGELEKAEEIRKRVERNRRLNPYYQHYLAQIAFMEERWEDAGRHARNAIRLQGGDYRFHYTLAQVEYRAGNLSRAEAALKDANRLAPDWVEASALALPGAPPDFPEVEATR